MTIDVRFALPESIHRAAKHAALNDKRDLKDYLADVITKAMQDRAQRDPIVRAALGEGKESR